MRGCEEKGESGGNIGTRYPPVLLQGCIYFVYVVYLSFGVRKTFLIVLSPGSSFYPPLIVFFLVTFCLNPDLSTLEIYILIINKKIGLVPH